jgi:hypothetical protein
LPSHSKIIKGFKSKSTKFKVVDVDNNLTLKKLNDGVSQEWSDYKDKIQEFDMKKFPKPGGKVWLVIDTRKIHTEGSLQNGGIHPKDLIKKTTIMQLLSIYNHIQVHKIFNHS